MQTSHNYLKYFVSHIETSTLYLVASPSWKEVKGVCYKLNLNVLMEAYLKS